MSQSIIFSGEMQLLRWSETSNAGATVTFQLADVRDLDRFKDMTLAKKGQAGQRIAAMMSEIGDDEQPVPVADKPKGGELARLAGIWCGQRSFYEFIRPQYDKKMGGNGFGHGDVNIGDGTLDVPDFCRHCILVFCDIESRAELDHDDHASMRFQELIRLPYMAYMNEQGANK